MAPPVAQRQAKQVAIVVSHQLCSTPVGIRLFITLLDELAVSFDRELDQDSSPSFDLGYFHLHHFAR